MFVTELFPQDQISARDLLERGARTPQQMASMAAAASGDKVLPTQAQAAAKRYPAQPAAPTAPAKPAAAAAPVQPAAGTGLGRRPDYKPATTDAEAQEQGFDNLEQFNAAYAQHLARRGLTDPRQKPAAPAATAQTARAPQSWMGKNTNVPAYQRKQQAAAKPAAAAQPVAKPAAAPAAAAQPATLPPPKRGGGALYKAVRNNITAMDRDEMLDLIDLLQYSAKGAK